MAKVPQKLERKKSEIYKERAHREIRRKKAGLYDHGQKNKKSA